MGITEEYVRKLKTLVVAIYQKDEKTIASLATSDMNWKVGNHWGNFTTLDQFVEEIIVEINGCKVKKIELHGCRTIGITKEIVQITGGYELIYTVGRSVRRIRYEILVTFLTGKIVYIQILAVKGTGSYIHKVKAVNEDCYVLEEEQVLYLEAHHNHVIWNCVNERITSNASLSTLQEELSEHFVRIQRGYLVNKDYVKCIRRCEVVMENGDVLPIPSKKYVKVKEELMK